VASYIPALARVDARQFGIALRTCDGEEAFAGDFEVPFSIQSVSKLFTLTLAMQRMGDALWERIGREPSGNPFNSLVQLENEQGKPRNPFINAGAIAVADRLVSQAEGRRRQREGRHPRADERFVRGADRVRRRGGASPRPTRAFATWRSPTS
jgi:glutaminase